MMGIAPGYCVFSSRIAKTVSDVRFIDERIDEVHPIRTIRVVGEEFRSWKRSVTMDLQVRLVNLCGTIG